jgi:hypothetical protein
VDRETAADMARQADLLLSEPLLLIVGTTGTARKLSVRELRAWRWATDGCALTELAVEEFELETRYCPSSALFG